MINPWLLTPNEAMDLLDEFDEYHREGYRDTNGAVLRRRDESALDALYDRAFNS